MLQEVGGSFAGGGSACDGGQRSSRCDGKLGNSSSYIATPQTCLSKKDTAVGSVCYHHLCIIFIRDNVLYICTVSSETTAQQNHILYSYCRSDQRSRLAMRAAMYVPRGLVQPYSSTHKVLASVGVRGSNNVYFGGGNRIVRRSLHHLSASLSVRFHLNSCLVYCTCLSSHRFWAPALHLSLVYTFRDK